MYSAQIRAAEGRTPKMPVSRGKAKPEASSFYDGADEKDRAVSITKLFVDRPKILFGG